MLGNFGDRTPTDSSTAPAVDAETNASAKPGVQENTDTGMMVVPEGNGAPQGFDPSQMPGDFGGMFPGQASDGTETAASGNADFARPSGGNFNPNMGGGEYTASSSAGLMWLAVSLLILGAGLLIAKRYQR